VIGGMLHKGAQNRQVLAQTADHGAPGLAQVNCWGRFEVEPGETIPAPRSDLLFHTPSLFGQVNANRVGLSGFLRSINGLPGRRGLADWRIRSDFTLRNPDHAGFVPPSVTKPIKGWAGCEQHKYLQHLRCVRALRPVVTQRANRPFTARGRACLARLSSTATRCLGQLPVPALTCFIASKTPANADRLAVPNTRPISGPIHITRNAAVGHPACGGALRFRPLQTKDTSCSPRS